MYPGGVVAGEKTQQPAQTRDAFPLTRFSYENPVGSKFGAAFFLGILVRRAGRAVLITGYAWKVPSRLAPRCWL